MALSQPSAVGHWTGDRPLSPSLEASREAIYAFGKPVYALQTDQGICLTNSGSATVGPEGNGSRNLLAYCPPLDLRNLGDPSFCDDYGIKYPYVAGAMANGIASVELVEAMSNAGMLAFFGAAGLTHPEISDAVDRLQRSLGDQPYGVNLINSPSEPGLEAGTVDILLAKGVRLIEASAYLRLTLPLVRYRVAGIHRNAAGEVVVPNRVIGKVSRVEVAKRFFSPPPENMLRELVTAGTISAGQAELAAQIPVAQDLTAEADSGGHTDNRPALALYPALMALRDRMQEEQGYPMPLRIGAAGGLSTPASVAGALALGAAYVVTGTVNQACVESGSSDVARQMLAEAEQADVAMAPAADMFEMGVKVQVLKRGTMFAMRAAKLYELYRAHDSLESIPAKDRQTLEKQYFRASLDDIWGQTVSYFQSRDPGQLTRADSDPKHKMALVFRWYLGLSSSWANSGVADRRMDYQIWCGPAMGAFNEWTRGSFLAEPANRRVVDVAKNLLFGAGALTRVNLLQAQGVRVALRGYRPLPPERLQTL